MGSNPTSSAPRSVIWRRLHQARDAETTRFWAFPFSVAVGLNGLPKIKERAPLDFENLERNYRPEAMLAAYQEAQIAAKLGEVPVGAVILLDGKVLARAHNLRESRQSPLAHAEVLALQGASAQTGSWRLSDCDLYCTLEPCPMCAGALVNARIRNLYFGAFDPKAGAIASLYGLASDPRLNHEIPWLGGKMGTECSELLGRFFGQLRTD